MLATNRSLPSRPPDIETTTDSSCTPAMLSAMSMAWRTISSASTRSTTEPAFMPLAAVWAKAKRLHAVAAPAQHVLRRLRLEPCDQADDLAGADIERGDDRRALRRNRLHLRGQAEAQHGHASPPLPDFLSWLSPASLSACSRAAAAPSDWRTVTRSGSRKSTVVMSRDSSFLLRSRSTSVRSACSGSLFRQQHLRRRS